MKQIPWLRVFVEGGVIVGSILLALAGDAWWDGIKEGRQGDEYVERLRRDLESDVSTWQSLMSISLSKQASLDRALEWVRTPEMSLGSVNQFLDDLTEGTRAAYGVTVSPERSTFDELINTGGLGLLGPGLRQALVGYHGSTDVQRARLTGRETAYAGRIYELVPRDPEFAVRSDLTDPERLRIAERALAADLEGLLIAERNHGRLARQIVGSLLDQATSVLALLGEGR